jgi:hypothetical protein
VRGVAHEERALEAGREPLDDPAGAQLDVVRVGELAAQVRQGGVEAEVGTLRQRDLGEEGVEAPLRGSARYIGRCAFRADERVFGCARRLACTCDRTSCSHSVMRGPKRYDVIARQGCKEQRRPRTCVAFRLFCDKQRRLRPASRGAWKSRSSAYSVAGLFGAASGLRDSCKTSERGRLLTSSTRPDTPG